ncbi:hypothetical protein [Leifsonia sp. fls2-241-R2A-40a]|uniref:WapI family immunity protein n=1 Tax=Leifsonia sp. fls2-241-R2A-40a TaxID=3040290 RepID=UPI00254C29E6|nr:hypothetical protein [Leifsonia sp. fls2-241-R2A-40a]
MRLQDEQGGRSVELRPSGKLADGDRVVVDAVVDDGERHWTLTEACLTGAEARDLAAWLAGIAQDATAAADEWTSLTFASNVVSMSGHRIPGGTVELRIALLRMLAADDRTADVVVGLRTTQEAVTSAARTFIRELDALP